jgi:plasmid maintenance system antidote protein VapI
LGSRQTKLEVMAADLAISRQAVSALLAGRIRPDVETAARAERAYRIGAITWLAPAEKDDMQLAVARNDVHDSDAAGNVPISNEPRHAAS